MEFTSYMVDEMEQVSISFEVSFLHILLRVDTV